VRLNEDRYPVADVADVLEEPISNEAVAWRFGAPYPNLLRRSFRKGLAHLAPWKRNPEQAPAPNTHRGFVPAETVYSGTVPEPTRAAYASLAEDRFPTEKFARLEALAHATSQRGVRVVFYELPTGDAPNWFSPEFRKAYEQALSQLVDAGFPLLRVPDTGDNRDYRNLDHLNSQGAAKASRYLLERLTEATTGGAANGDAPALPLP